MKDILLSGNSENPYHCSVSCVFLKDSKVTYIQKVNGSRTLPRETIHLTESILEGLQRGAAEELGVEIQVGSYIGSLQTKFVRPNEFIEIEKTTLYFKTTVVKILDNKKLELDELEDRVFELDIQELINIFKLEGNTEYQILERLIVK